MTKSYPVLSRLIHDGKIYDPLSKPGVTIDLDEAVAADLPDGILGEGVEVDAKGKKPPAA
ncbi:MAG: hypothetical protein ABTQ29_08165 [Siculibacillus sp.]